MPARGASPLTRKSNKRRARVHGRMRTKIMHVDIGFVADLAPSHGLRYHLSLSLARTRVQCRATKTGRAGGRH